MKILRFRRSPDKPANWGWLSGDKIGLIDGSPFAEFRRGEANIAADKVEILPPVEPSKIVCVGRNYVAHAAELENEVPDLPLLFLKPPSAVIGSGDEIVLPPQSENVQHEAELAIVICQRGRWISPGDIPEHILGFTAANDVTARDLQYADGQWARGKGFDTFLPLGPWIETELDPADVMITCLVNGQLRQMASTRDMVFPVTQLVGYVSSIMTLEAGDVILTGTPAGVGPLVDGDEVSVEIEGIGTLTNPVRAASRLP
jgi:2-keto-4-pentenoate hydratase/2-oxohepta-3-ene-1,7-dioic acid hydratase in catechol pathway